MHRVANTGQQRAQGFCWTSCCSQGETAAQVPTNCEGHVHHAESCQSREYGPNSFATKSATATTYTQKLGQKTTSQFSACLRVGLQHPQLLYMVVAGAASSPASDAKIHALPIAFAPMASLELACIMFFWGQWRGNSSGGDSSLAAFLFAPEFGGCRTSTSSSASPLFAPCVQWPPHLHLFLFLLLIRAPVEAVALWCASTCPGII